MAARQTLTPQQKWYASEINLRNQVIVDLGANVGEQSEFFWLQGKGQNIVISVEPLSENIKQLNRKIKKHKTKAWQLVQAVVNNTNNPTRVLFQQDTESGWNSVVIDDEKLASKNIIPVRSQRLSDIHPEPTVVKIDIEGHEYVVLNDAVATMPSIHSWAVELHMRKEYPLEGALKLFEENGFTIFAAGTDPANPGVWKSIPISSALTWNQIPVAKINPDGSVFKSLHIIAKRKANG
jgi:FkbM family methyltransferase